MHTFHLFQVLFDRIDFLKFRCITSIAFNAVFTLTRLSFYEQLLEQITVASLPCITVFLQYYSLLLLYFRQINDGDDDDDYQLLYLFFYFLHVVVFTQNV